MKFKTLTTLLQLPAKKERADPFSPAKAVEDCVRAAQPRRDLRRISTAALAAAAADTLLLLRQIGRVTWRARHK